MTALPPKLATPQLRLQLFPQIGHSTDPEPAPAHSFGSHNQPRSHSSSSRSRPAGPSGPDNPPPSGVLPVETEPSQRRRLRNRSSNSTSRPRSSASSRNRSGSGSASSSTSSSSHNIMSLGRSESTATSASIAIAFSESGPGSAYHSHAPPSQTRQAGPAHSVSATHPMSFSQESGDPAARNRAGAAAAAARRPLQTVSSNAAGGTASAPTGKAPNPRLASGSRNNLVNAQEEELKHRMEERRRLREQQQQQQQQHPETHQPHSNSALSSVAKTQAQAAAQHSQRPFTPPTQLAVQVPSASATAGGIGQGISSPGNAPEPAPFENGAPSESAEQPAAPAPAPIQSIFPQFNPHSLMNMTSAVATTSGTATASAPSTLAAPAPVYQSSAVRNAPSTLAAPAPVYQSSAVRNAPPAGPASAAPTINIPSAAEPVGPNHHARASTAKSFQPTTPGYVLPPDTLSQPSPAGDNDLKVMWDVSNGMHIDDARLLLQTASDVICFPMLPTTEPELKPVKGMVRPLPVLFGPGTEQKPFYTVRQAAFPASDDVVEPHEREHELIVFRHHPSVDTDALPIAHVGLVPPPPPDSSTTRSAGTPLTVPTTPVGLNGSKTHVCSITPVLANLQALDAMAATPMGQALATSDPHAQSAEAQQLAQTVLAQTTQREAGHVYWSKTGPTTGSYEVHHPAFAGHKLTVLVSGDFVRSAFGALGQADRRKPLGQQRPTAGYRFGITEREIAVTIWAPEQMYDQPEVASPAASGFGQRDRGAEAESSQSPGARGSQSNLPSLKLDTSTPTIRGRGHFSFSSTAAHRSSRAPQSSTGLVASAVSASLVPGLVQAHATGAPAVAATHRPLLCFNLTNGNLYLYPNSLLPLTTRSRFIFDLATSTALVVAAAEGRRGADRGLFFAAPPKPIGVHPSASSSHTSVASVFSHRGRESADSGATENDDEDDDEDDADADADADGGSNAKSFLTTIKSRFSRRPTRPGQDVELGPVHHHSRHYGRSGNSSRTQLNPAAPTFSPVPTNPQTPFSAGSHAHSVAWPRSLTEAQDTTRWATPLSNVMDGIAGDLGFQTREQRQHELRREHQRMLEEMQNGKSRGAGTTRRAERKARKKAEQVDKAKHSWPTRLVVGTAVLGFRVVLWFFKLLFRLASAAFRVISRRLDSEPK